MRDTGQHGGGGGSASDACHLVEEMSYGLAPLFGLGVSLVSATVVERFGTEEQKQDILGGVCRGEVLATAISEPGAGSDPASMMCRAERRGDSYVINGQKTWISCAHIASRIQVLCRTDTSGSKHDGITMIDVPADAEGLEVRTITRALIFRVLPVLAMTIAAGVAVLKWHQVSLRADHRASIESVQAATEATIMMLSYNADTVERDLGTARDVLTGSFRDAYISLTDDVVIPGAKQRQISAVATVPAASSVFSSENRAVVLVFVNQATTVGSEAPSDSASSVKVTLDKHGGRWLVSGFDPI